MKVQEIKVTAIAHGSIVTFEGSELRGLTKVGSHEGQETARIKKLQEADEDVAPLTYHNYSLGGRVFTVDTRREADIQLLDQYLGVEAMPEGKAKPKLAEIQLIANDYTRKKRNELGVETDEDEIASSWKLNYVVTYADAMQEAADQKELNKARGIVGGVSAPATASEVNALRAEIAALAKARPAMEVAGN